MNISRSTVEVQRRWVRKSRRTLLKTARVGVIWSGQSHASPAVLLPPARCFPAALVPFLPYSPLNQQQLKHVQRNGLALVLGAGVPATPPSLGECLSAALTYHCIRNAYISKAVFRDGSCGRSSASRSRLTDSNSAWKAEVIESSILDMTEGGSASKCLLENQ